MDLSQKIIAAILAGFFLVALIRVFSSPFRLALNLWNALVIAVLGLPGFVLLLLVQWIL